MWKWLALSLPKGADVQMWKCEDVEMWKFEDAGA